MRRCVEQRFFNLLEKDTHIFSVFRHVLTTFDHLVSSFPGLVTTPITCLYFPTLHNTD